MAVLKGSYEGNIPSYLVDPSRIHSKEALVCF